MPKTSLQKIELSSYVVQVKKISFFIISVIVIMLFLPWEQTTQGSGKLIAYNPSERDYTIHAPISGFIKTYNVEENKFVKKGDLLFEMVDLDANYTSKLENIQSDIQRQYINEQESLHNLQDQKSNLSQNLTTGLLIHDKKIAQIEDSLKNLKNQKLQVQNSYRVAKSNYERVKLLFADGIESKRSYEVADNEYVRVRTLLKSVQINIEKESKTLEIQKREKDSFAKVQENKIKTMQNSIISSQNRLKTLAQNRTNSSINVSRNASAKVYATKDGHAVRILINDKDRFVKQGDLLLHFAPRVTKRAILLKVKALDMPLIKKGLKARIQFYGWPSLQVSGWPKITYGTFGGIVEKMDPIAHEDNYYYVYVVEDPKDPWPKNAVLRVGTKATVWVRLSTVRIWYEIWRLHNAQPAIMTSEKE